MRVVSSGEHQGRFRAVLEHILVPLLCLVVSILFTILFFIYANAFGGLTYYNYTSYSSSADGVGSTGNFACNSGGNVVFPWLGSSNELWDPNLFLTITLASGSLTFTQAKAIDIIWDLVVGRGGQMLLAFLAYPGVRKSLLTALERKPLRMPFVATLTFEHFSVTAWWETTRELCRAWSWRLFGYLWIIMYLLAFGTLVGAMTGYQANMQPYYDQESGSNLMAFSNVKAVQAVRLVDGDRVGLEQDALVLNLNTDPTYPLWQYSQMTSYYCHSSVSYSIRSNHTNGSFTATDAIDSSGSSYSIDYDKLGTYTASNSSFAIKWIKDEAASKDYANRYQSEYSYSSGTPYQNLPPIVINCTTSNVTLSNHTYTLDTLLNFNQSSLNQVYQDQSGKLLNETWLEEHSQCQVLQTYQWGFSSLLLFTFCLMTVLFFADLLALHVDTWQRSQTNRVKQHFSLYRDILDFAAQLRGEIGDKADDMPAKDLTKSVAIKADYVSVSAYEYPSSRRQEARMRKKQKEPFNFRTDSIPSLKKVGSEMRAGHAYSMGEMKRALGITYGPVRKPSADEYGWV